MLRLLHYCSERKGVHICAHTLCIQCTVHTGLCTLACTMCIPGTHCAYPLHTLPVLSGTITCSLFVLAADDWFTKRVNVEELAPASSLLHFINRFMPTGASLRDKQTNDQSRWRNLDYGLVVRSTTAEYSQMPLGNTTEASIKWWGWQIFRGE